MPDSGFMRFICRLMPLKCLDMERGGTRAWGANSPTCNQTKRKTRKQEYVNEREWEAGKRDITKGRQWDQQAHTMLWLSSTGNKSNVSLNITHGSTHGSLDLGWETMLNTVQAFWHIQLVHLTPSGRKRQICESHNSHKRETNQIYTA